MSLSLDRLLTLYFFAPLARLFPPRKGIHIPILMYHSISDEKESGHPYFWINTSPARFAEQMKFLYDNGYKVISLSEAVDLIRGKAQQSLLLNPQLATRNSRYSLTRNSQPGARNPEQSLVLNSQPATRNAQQSLLLNPQLATRNSHHSLTRNSQLATRNSRWFLTRNPQPATRNPVVLTFDDGYHDFYTHAFPVLKKYGFSTNVFLPTAYLDDSKPGLKGKQHLSWKDVRELQDEGVTFGSHTVNHLQMQGLNARQVEYEITKSKEVIEEKTGRPLKSFCYPFKFPERDKAFICSLKETLQQKGYKNGVCTRIGTAHSANDLYSLKRIPVNSDDGLPLFRSKLHGGYDWVYRAQLISKLLKS